MYETIEIVIESISNIINNYNINIPNIQRIIDNSKINEIVEYHKDMYLNNGEYKFLGVISLCKYSENYYLVDGQHRYISMKKLYNDYRNDFNIFLQIINVNNIRNVEDVFNNINKNTPLPSIVFDNINTKNIIQECYNYFLETYPYIFSDKSKCHRPSIYKNYFQELLKYLQEYLRCEESKSLINIIEEYNNSFVNKNYEDFNNITENMYNIAKKNKFYLGLYKYEHEQEYGYIWCKEMIEYRCHIKIIKNVKEGKKKIKKAFRENIWNIYVGNDIRAIKCQICNDSEIKFENFECGHIIAEANGGTIDIDNLLPICGKCNKSMNTMCMDDYVKENYKNNYNNYILYKNKQIDFTKNNKKDNKKNNLLNIFRK
jgi:hypothetical protein